MRVVCWVAWRYYSGNKGCVIKKKQEMGLGAKTGQQVFFAGRMLGSGEAVDAGKTAHSPLDGNSALQQDFQPFDGGLGDGLGDDRFHRWPA